MGETYQIQRTVVMRNVFFEITGNFVETHPSNLQIIEHRQPTRMALGREIHF